MTNPVHVVRVKEIGEEGEEYLPGWYFWDETWCHRHGPFSTKKEAEQALIGYAESL